MGGRAKGLLRTSEGARVIDRTLALARRISRNVALVGASGAYDVEVPRIEDTRAGAGPLGGLSALLEHAGEASAIALACDMPLITYDLLGRLASYGGAAAALAPRRDGRWESLFSRFDSPRALPVVRARLARGSLSLQGLFEELAADELPLSPSEARLLSDWDRPEDLP